MMVEKILKISLSSLMILLLSSCSIAGSWVYERLDSYLADYFKEFADFSKEQNQEIELISEEFLNWFSENELLKIKLLIEDLKKIDLKNPEERVALAYRQGEEIFRKVNNFFERPIINFSKGDLLEESSRIASKRLMRLALDHHLGNKSLNIRKYLSKE